MLTLSWAH